MLDLTIGALVENIVVTVIAAVSAGVGAPVIRNGADPISREIGSSGRRRGVHDVTVVNRQVPGLGDDVDGVSWRELRVHVAARATV